VEAIYVWHESTQADDATLSYHGVLTFPPFSVLQTALKGFYLDLSD